MTTIMNNKRKRPVDSLTSTQPNKRQQFLPSTPAQRTNVQRQQNQPNFPSVSDSPTNPFGRTRVMSLALPAPTWFGKHLPLRFQLVRDAGGHPAGRTRGEGVYRIVQVPLSYTFRLLHLLLYFVFDGPNAMPEVKLASSSSRRRRASEGESRSGLLGERRRGGNNKRKKGLGRVVHRGDIKNESKVKNEDEPQTGHLFEAVREVKMQRGTYRPGQIKSCTTWAKLSSVRNPYRYREVLSGEDDGATFEDVLPEVEMCGEDRDDEEWTWEEEDMTLDKVWPKGIDLTRGIVYHHDSRTQVHITMNALPIHGRRGEGNEPFVFQAGGEASLGGTSVREVENISTKAWNRTRAFGRFLKRVGGPTAVQVDVTENVGDISQSTLAISTPDLSTCKTSSIWSASQATPYSDVVHTPFTPGPKHLLHRLRLDHTQKRIARLARKGREGLADFQSDTEDEEDELAGDTELYSLPLKTNEEDAKVEAEVTGKSWWQGPRTWEWDNSSVDELADDPDLQPSPELSLNPDAGVAGVNERPDPDAKVAEWLVKGRKEIWLQALTT